MKTAKEIKLAARNFLRIFKNNEAYLQDGTFIPFSPHDYFKQQQLILTGAVLFGIIGLYLAYNAFWVDAVYYWHIDLPVIIGTVMILIYFVIFLRLTYKYYQFNQVTKVYFKEPNKCPFGILITDDYYFENTPGTFHIIARDNIVKIDYEEQRKDGYYLELLIEEDEDYILQGISYKPNEYDIKAWVHGAQKQAEE